MRRPNQPVSINPRTSMKIENLEQRTMLSAATAHVALPRIMAPAAIIQPGNGDGVITGLTPAQLKHAYGFDKLDQRFKNDARFRTLFQNLGVGQTIGIVAIADTNVDPLIGRTATNDNLVLQKELDEFSKSFNLTSTIIQTTTLPASTQLVPFGVVGIQMLTNVAMVVEWVHALLPMAQINLVETDDNLLSYMDGVDRASDAVKGKGDVVIMANGFPEDTPATPTGTNFDIKALESHFTDPNHSTVSYVAPASARDPLTTPQYATAFVSGTPFNNEDPSRQNYPASSPNVLSVGETTLTTTSNGTRITETPYRNSTSDFSHFGNLVNANTGSGFQQPPYQAGVTVNKKDLTAVDPFKIIPSNGSAAIVHRAAADVSFLGDPTTGVAVLDRIGSGGWVQTASGGLGAAAWGVLASIANQMKAIVNGATSTIGVDQLPSAAYNAAKIHYAQNYTDVKRGQDFPGRPFPIPRYLTSVPEQFTAYPGYDLPTGWGTPRADQMAFSLAGLINGNANFSSIYTKQLAEPGQQPSGLPSIKDFATFQFTGIGNVVAKKTSVDLILIMTNLTPSSQSSGVGEIQVNGPLRRVGKNGFKGTGSATIQLRDGNGTQFQRLRINGTLYKYQGRMYAHGQFAAVDVKGNLLEVGFHTVFRGNFIAKGVPAVATA